MKLTSEFLKQNLTLTNDFVKSDITQRLEFFTELLDVAAIDLALAHSVFKVSSCRTILSLVGKQYAYPTQIGAFSVHKKYDTITLTNNTVSGKKHWITNLAQAELAVMQVHDGNKLQLCLADLTTANKEFLFFSSIGMMDSETGDASFESTNVEVLFSRDDPRYFVSNNHNNLCFITNYLGVSKGLLKYLTPPALELKSRYVSLKSLLEHHIVNTSQTTTSSDQFWHLRNSLYLESKQLLVDICSYIIANTSGTFYQANTVASQQFLNALIYAGHNGAVNNHRKILFIEPQDY